MKKAGFFAVAAASSAALAAGSTVSPTEGSGARGKEAGSGSPRKGAEKGEFTPRFDGLRFIETLVTAHR
ncbi:hypothetical protein J5N97_021631 [Dioscorea zingiberensis]|uniref:Uncharacterized protein n=1 Tax=Dioscorea zingiberensis TaxID=325984 RepID=A0A9D5C9J6_9LILI|nr:hypothetical protein J5N97_021631 [Dioscorea zingiberensis]